MAKDKKQPCELHLKITLDCVTYWDIIKILSKGCFLNVCMGGRGIGKTTQANILGCMNFRDNGEEFIYLRRYKTECSAQEKLLDKIVDGTVFKGDKKGGGSYSWGGNTLGYIVPLSIAQQYKSMNFENVSLIVYDEAIIPTGSNIHYLKDEVVALLEFASTVFRHRKNGKILVLGNNLNFFNPYCQYFNVKVFNGLYVDKKRGLLVEYAKHSVELLKIEEDTPLFKLTKGTAYHDYHYNNDVMVANKVVCVEKKPNDKLRARFVFNDYTLNVYVRSDSKLLLESVRKIIEEDITYHILDNDQPNYYNIEILRKTWFSLLKYRYYHFEINYVNQDAYTLMEYIVDMM